MNERLEGTGWRVYKSTPDVFSIEEVRDGDADDAAYVAVVKRADRTIDISTRCANDIPPAVARVIAAKLTEFADGCPLRRAVEAYANADPMVRGEAWRGVQEAMGWAGGAK